MTNTDLVKQGDSYNRKLYFCWFLVDWCNYACSYCCTMNAQHNKFNKNPNPSLHKLVLARLKKIQDPFLLMLVGGEPTLHPHIDEIISSLAEIPMCEAEVHTNLSRGLKFYENLFDNHSNLHIKASYHPEYHNQEFIDKSIALKDKNYAVHINLSDNPDDWPKTREMINALKQGGVKVYYQKLYSANEREINYSQEFYDNFGKEYADMAGNDNWNHKFYYSDGSVQTLTPLEVYEKELNKFKGWSCRTQMFNIDIEGNFLNYCTLDKLPMVFDTDDLYKNVICPVEQGCDCDQMFNFPKEKL